jgi:hypothetical protein
MYYQIVNNGLKIKTEDQELLFNGDNKLNTQSISKTTINDSIHVYLSKENNTDNYYLYINSTKGDLLTAKLTINGIDKNWEPKPFRVNLLKIPNDILEKGIKLTIPEFEFYEFYDTNSHHSKCDISDRTLIEELN